MPSISTLLCSYSFDAIGPLSDFQILSMLDLGGLYLLALNASAIKLDVFFYVFNGILNIFYMLPLVHCFGGGMIMCLSACRNHISDVKFVSETVCFGNLYSAKISSVVCNRSPAERLFILFNMGNLL